MRARSPDLVSAANASSRFREKVAIVTGATSGIGREVAVRLAAEGTRVVLAGRRAGRAEQIVAQILERGGDAIYVRTDVTDSAAVGELVEHAVRSYGRLDLAFNNAGVSGAAPSRLADQVEACWESGDRRQPEGALAMHEA